MQDEEGFRKLKSLEKLHNSGKISRQSELKAAKELILKTTEMKPFLKLMLVGVIKRMHFLGEISHKQMTVAESNKEFLNAAMRDISNSYLDSILEEWYERIYYRWDWPEQFLSYARLTLKEEIIKMF
jgi:hypothetical protein